jgi:hypothetical protein
VPDPQSLCRLLQSRPYPSFARERRPSWSSRAGDWVTRSSPTPQRTPSRICPDGLNGRHNRERQLETEIVCSGCTLRYAVYGVFAFCPDCGQHNSLQILDTNLVIIGKLLDLAEGAEPELATKLVENALEDCVSAFDGFGRELCRIYMARSPTTRLDRWTFQSLDAVRSNIQDFAGIDLSTLVPSSDWSAAVIGFQKRHLVAHKMGVVDQGYITKTGDIRYAIGRKVDISASEVRDLTRIIKVLAEHIAKAVLPPP